MPLQMFLELAGAVSSSAFHFLGCCWAISLFCSDGKLLLRTVSKRREVFSLLRVFSVLVK